MSPASPSTRNAVLILNPKAGQGRRLDEVRAALARRPWLRVLETREPGDPERLARGAVDEGAELVVAAGGDGTVGGVVNGIASKRPASACLGLLPLGTANDFSKTLGIPQELEAALQVLDGDERRPIDLVRVSSGEGRVRFFLNAASGGASSIIRDRVTDDMKRRWKGLAYLRAAVGLLGSLPQFRLSISMGAAGRRLDVETPAMLVANGRFVGGLELAPAASPDDQLLDVAIVTAATLGEETRLLLELLRGTHTESDHLIHFKTRRLELQSDPPMPFNGDGEALGETPMRFEADPGALCMLAGPAEPRQP